MITKLAILFCASACLAYPTIEEQRPQSAPIVPHQGIPLPQGIPEPQSLPPSDEHYEVKPQDEVVPLPPQGTAGGKPENSDLKTDNSFWYRRSYYPVIYRRSYYPRSYSTYSYSSPYYSYWNPYSWW